MTLLIGKDISLEFGEQRILKEASFSIEAGERVCLIGRNGAGKSTLFKLITNQILPDSGDIKIKTNLRISQLEQTLPSEREDTVYDYVARGLEKLQALLVQHEERTHKTLDKAGLRKLENLQYQIEASGGWNIDTQIQSTLSELGLPADRKLRELSGGWQRRAALARALVSQPELLLLDEPTNHLDLNTIQWLEDKAYAFAGSILFVTHDRAFLQSLAMRILELDRGKLTSWPGHYKRFLFEKEKFLEVEARNHARFDKRLEQEEAWIRQGIKARRTRNEGRVRALGRMREVYAQRVKPENSARISVEEAERSGRKVIDAHNITHGYDHELLIKGLKLKIRRGDRIGLIGNNGAGKSTLLKILLGEMHPQQGTVKLGTHLQIGYFDQHRRRLDPEKTIVETVGDGSDYIKVNGKDRHVIGYLKGFLFSPRRSMTRIKVLSGGECNRVILAQLFTKPTNLLVLDEPTNDLDMETLEVLEERLLEYKGTLIVVSHDREFLDNVVTSTLAFETGGHVQSYAGGYSDWLKQGKALHEADNPNQNSTQNHKPDDQETKPGHKAQKPEKLSYKLQLELNQLPDKIELLEKAINDLQAQTQQQNFYGQGFEKVQPVLNRIATKQSELEQAMGRWSELEKM